MSTSHEHRPDSPPPGARSPRPWGRLAAGTTAAAAVLGVGAYMATDHIVDKKQQDVAHEVRRIDTAAPVTTFPSAASASPIDSATAPAEPPILDAAGSPIPSEVVEEIKEARRKMAEDGVPVKPPVTPQTTRAAQDVEMTTKGSIKEGGIVRMITAHSDLTGQRELAYVAGGVKEHRDVPCTQTFKFSNNEKPKKRDNLVMCWRTSAEKSVIAMIVDPEGKPSRDKAVDALEKEWRSMG